MDDRAHSRRAILTGDLRRTLLWLALPILLQQFLEFLVGFVDTFLSGRISRDATSAIGVASYVGWLASLVFGLVGTGTTALVARAWGSGDFAEGNRTTNRSMVLAVILGFAFYAAIYSAAPVLAGLLEMQGERFRITVHYLRIDGFGHIFNSLSLVGAAALRGTGDMRSPMAILGLVSILNVLVSPLLVFGTGPVPELGIDGIVLGTLLARMSGGGLMLALLGYGLSGLKLKRDELTLQGDIIRRILRIGVPAGLDGMIIWGGQLVFLKLISQLGDVAFAAHVVGIQVEAITFLPAVAWGYAAATMIGQSLGAGAPQRALRTGHEAVLQCSLLALLISLTFFFGASAIYRFMHTDSLVHAAGIPAFRALAFFQLPLIVAIIYVYSLRGAGSTRVPMLINSCGILCIRLPLAYLGGIVWDGGLLGAWVGMFADIGFRALLVAICYSRGRWTGVDV